MRTPVLYKTAGPQRLPGYETTDARAKPLALALAGLGILLAVVFAAMWALFVYFDNQYTVTASRETKSGEVRQPSGPLLQTSPSQDLEVLLERENRILTSYGWVNKASGLIRIPITKAMDIAVQKGLPNLPPIGQKQDSFDRRPTQETPRQKSEE